MLQVLLYADDHALTSYLGGAALDFPQLVDTPCEVLELDGLAEDPEPGVLPMRGLHRALLFREGPELPESGPHTLGAVVQTGTFNRGKRVLTVHHGEHKLRYKVANEASDDPKPLVELLVPYAWGETPSVTELVYLCPRGGRFTQLVTEHLELGRNHLRFSAVRGKDVGERVVLEVLDPSWFVLERWVPPAGSAGNPDTLDAEGNPVVRAYRRLRGTLGPRRIYLEWGYRHPLEDWLVEPSDEDTLLLVDRTGAHHAVQVSGFRDLTEVLALDPSQFATEALAPSEVPERVPVALRLEGRGQPRDPELWILPADERERLEVLLTQTPEDELQNLMIAYVEGGEGKRGGQRFFAVREVLTGRAPRLLPLDSRSFATLPGMPNLLLPIDQVIAPPLSNDRYARAFGLQPGVLTILEAVQSDPELPRRDIEITRVEERHFQPIESLIDFVFDGDAERLEQVVLNAPFDLGRFEEEDLLPARIAKEKERGPKPQRDEVPATPVAVTPVQKPKGKGLMGRLRDTLSRGAGSTEAAADPGTPDPRAIRIGELEEALVLQDAGAEAWWELSQLLTQDRQPEESLRAAENALWVLKNEQAQEAWEILRESLGEPSGEVADTEDLYRVVFRYRADAQACQRGGGQAEVYRQLTEAVYATMREHEGRLRKKSRWLLWQQVLQETGHQIEEERLREDILSELVLRGIEDREVPPFARRILLESYGLRAATGAGATEALNFLQRARDFAASLGHPALRSEALAHVAWALAELGEGEKGGEVAQQALREAQASASGPPHMAYRARTVARIGAVRERVVGHGEGRTLLERSLGRIVELMSGDGSSTPTQESVDAHKAFGAWFEAIADALSSGGLGPSDPLLQQGLGYLVERPADQQVQVLAQAAPALQRLGAGDQGRGIARALLRGGQLKPVHLDGVVKALEIFEDGRAVSAEDAEHIIQALMQDPEAIDEFSVENLLVALRGLPTGAFERTEQLRQDLLQRNLSYAARLVRLAGLRRLADLRDRKRGPELLAESLADAWTHQGGTPPGTERMRLVTRLAQLVPMFGMRERGLELLGQIRAQAQDERDVYQRNELLMSASLAASQLGDSRASFDLIQEVAEDAIGEFERGQRSSQNPIWLLFETLDACVNGAAVLGETKRGLQLAQRVAQVARDALGQSAGAHEVARYFYLRTLIQCGHAQLVLGETDAAEACFRDAFHRLREAQGYDLIDLLHEANATAGKLDGTHRYGLALQVIESAEASGEEGDQFERFAVDLTSEIARNMVQGESAFAAALKRWKGREERLIRNRVARESCVQP